MSGGFRTGKKKSPALKPRPDLENPSPDAEAPKGQGELPSRIYLHATVRVKTLKPLARVKRKGWVRPGKWPTLWLEMSEYITDIKNYTALTTNRTKRQKQALQVCLHEMMHLALWDDLLITHSPYEDSLLHYYVDGKTLVPNEWDLIQMKKAARRIGRIEINLGDLQHSHAAMYLVLLTAVKTWNQWIGREFFQVTKEA